MYRRGGLFCYFRGEKSYKKATCYKIGVHKISHCSNWPINYFKVADFIRLRCDEEFVQWLDMACIDRDGQNFEVSKAICPTSRSDSTVRTILLFDKYVCSVLESMRKSVRTIQSKNQRFLAFEGKDWILDIERILY